MDPHLRQCRLGRGLHPYQVVPWSIQPFGHHNTPTLQTGQTGQKGEWSRTTRWTVICNGRPKTAINDARLAPTPKPEIENYGKNHINELAVPDFLFDFNTIYGHIYQRLAVKDYFRFRQNRK